MEHRWGIRRRLDLGVRLYAGSEPSQLGRLVDASSSGGYVTTSAPPPVMTPVQLALGRDGSQGADRHRIAGYVVRSDPRGIGIEWQYFAPSPVLALIDALRTLPSADCLAGIRAVREAREDVAYVPLSRSNSAFGAPHNGG